MLVASIAACGSDGEDADADARGACTQERALVDRLVETRSTPEVLDVVETPAGTAWIVREALGDRTTLCPDCNDDETLPFCGDCAHDVVRYVVGATSIELGRSYARASYDRVFAASAAVTSTGDVAVAWQRRLGASGISPSEARYARVTADGTRSTEPVQLYESEGGRLRLVAHPRDPKVLALRDHTVLLAHVGTHVSVVDLEGATLLPWTALGSSLAYEAGASAHRDAFVVAFSDQAVDTPDPDCQPCTTLETCFAGNVIDVTEELPSMGCVAYLDATEAGGLQAVTVSESGIGAPVQIRSGWYDRVYGGEMQRLYSDHGHASVVETESGFTVVADYLGDLRFSIVRVDVDFAAGRIEQRVIPIELGGGSPTWYALRHIEQADVLFVGMSHSNDGESRSEVRAMALDATPCAVGALLAAFPDAVTRPLALRNADRVAATISYWDDTGGAFERVELRDFGLPID